MEDALKKVAEFHSKHRFPNDTLGWLPSLHNTLVRQMIGRIDGVLEAMSKNHLDEALKSETNHGDLRLYRIHLMLEELHEVCSAMMEQDDVELADALADLLYVVIGTAITYRIPIDRVFEEVHRSNMTKKRRDPIRDPRMRDKGSEYQKPDILAVLQKGKQDANRFKQYE